MTRDDGEEFDAVLRAVAASPSVALPVKGALGDRFHLVRRLGAGGFGVVYEAEDLRDRGRVALKMLRHAEADWLYRFKREFRSLQGLVHPNLVALDELFCDGEQWFFTMELVDGVTFVGHAGQGEATLSAAGLSGAGHESFHERRLRDGLRQLFEGLAVLHAAGKVHRDIKPSNVLVTREGRVVLIDFGLVADSFQTAESMAAGTPAYMAPEQAASREVGPAADVYAAGVMLYEVLTGRMPIEGRPLQVLIDKQTREPVPPSSIAPGIPDDLDALCMRLLHFDPALRPTSADVWRALAAAGAAPSVAPRGLDGAATFVGRSAELGGLRAAFDASAKGRLATVLICGESGIGKSHLVRRFAGQLLAERPDTMLLEGRCHEREAIPYKAVDGIVDALSRRLSRMPASDVAALLPTRRALLARIFPVMLRIPQLAQEQARAENAAGPRSDLRQRAFLALRELFTRVALSRPTVIAVDDLQWADDDGLHALAEILRPPDAPPLLFIGTVRVAGGRGDGGLERLHVALPGDVRVMSLTRLANVEARELASMLLRQAGAFEVDPESIAVEAGGHPLFVEELARLAAVGGPAAADLRLDEAIWSRVVQLEPRPRELAEVVAAAGKPLPQEVAARAAHLEPAEFPRRVAILRASNLVRTTGARWADAIEPYHDRVREAVLARLEPSRRRAVHEALAIAFEASSHLDPETLATHWREAGSLSRAAAYAAAAGDEAFRALAFDRAMTWFEQALDWLPEGDVVRREVRVKLGDTLAFSGRGALAASQFEIAAAEAPPLQALELRRRAAEQLLRSGHFDRGIEASRVVLAAIGMRIPATRFQTILSLVYCSLLLRLRGFGFRERPGGQVTPEELMRIDACRSVAAGLTFVETFVGLVFQRRALVLALAAGDIERIIPLLGMEAASSAVAGGRTWRRTERLLGHTRELAERSGSLQARAWVNASTGIALYLNGRFREAREKLVGTMDMLQDGSTGLVQEGVTARMFAIQALAFLGSFRELRRWQTEGLRAAVARGDVYAAVNLRIGFANLAWLVEDRPDLAEAEMRSARQEWSSRGFHNEHCYALMAHVAITLYVKDVEKGYALAGELARRTRQSLFWRIQTIRLRVLYLHGASALAMMEHAMGDRRTLLREATRDARAIEREGAGWMRPFARVLRAGIALHDGAREIAARALDAAALDFDACDMTAYAAAARGRLARLRADRSTDSEIARASDLLRAEGVVAPERMIAMLVPGLGPPS
jgi:tRNA A-37 threonylcarbamoyl transferase component Bud32